MDSQQVPLRVTATRFVRSLCIFLGSEVGGRAKLMFAGLVALLCGLNGLNAINNYIGRRCRVGMPRGRSMNMETRPRVTTGDRRRGRGFYERPARRMRKAPAHS